MQARRQTLHGKVADFERQQIEAALEECGTVIAAARLLGIPRSTFYYKLKALGIDARQYRKCPDSWIPSGDGSTAADNSDSASQN